MGSWHLFQETFRKCQWCFTVILTAVVSSRKHLTFWSNSWLEGPHLFWQHESNISHDHVMSQKKHVQYLLLSALGHIFNLPNKMDLQISTTVIFSPPLIERVHNLMTNEKWKVQDALWCGSTSRYWECHHFILFSLASYNKHQ